jgi:hypothetical protein
MSGFADCGLSGAWVLFCCMPLADITRLWFEMVGKCSGKGQSTYVAASGET